MPIAILDPFAGISGDMTLGALLDLGVDRQWIEALPARLGFPRVGVRIRSVERGAVASTKVDFDIPRDGDGHGRHLGELLDLVGRAPVSDRVRDRARRAFQLIGTAEGRVHGVTADRVHLHEVGAIDAVLDIIGAVEGFERLGTEQVFHLPVAVGNGWVDTAHGKLPVPAPATAVLLEGIEVRAGGPVVGEATTPTGAALVRVLSSGPPPAAWRMVRSGWGAGGRDPDGYPNALRILVAESAHEAGLVELLATDIDDLSPEYIEPLREALFAAGALDCQVWPTQAKQGRVGLRIEAVAAADASDRVIDALFAHSTTAGIRRWPASRVTLPRQELIVELDGSVRVRVKVLESPAGLRLKPEYTDVVAAAGVLARPAFEVAREATRLAEVATQNGKEWRNAVNKE